MTGEEILGEVTGVFRKVLRREVLELALTTTAGDVDGWDSLTHVLLIDAVEQHFGVKFKLIEVMNFKNVGDMCGCVGRKLSG